MAFNSFNIYVSLTLLPDSFFSFSFTPVMNSSSAFHFLSHPIIRLHPNSYSHPHTSHPTVTPSHINLHPTFASFLLHSSPLIARLSNHYTAPNLISPFATLSLVLLISFALLHLHRFLLFSVLFLGLKFHLLFPFSLSLYSIHFLIIFF